MYRAWQMGVDPEVMSSLAMWMIIPGASRPIPVTPNQRLMGGASMGDVASLRFAEDFTATLPSGRRKKHGLHFIPPRLGAAAGRAAGVDGIRSAGGAPTACRTPQE